MRYSFCYIRKGERARKSRTKREYAHTICVKREKERWAEGGWELKVERVRGGNKRERERETGQREGRGCRVTQRGWDKSSPGCLATGCYPKISTTGATCGKTSYCELYIHAYAAYVFSLNSLVKHVDVKHARVRGSPSISHYRLREQWSRERYRRRTNKPVCA